MIKLLLDARSRSGRKNVGGGGHINNLGLQPLRLLSEPSPILKGRLGHEAARTVSKKKG